MVQLLGLLLVLTSNVGHSCYLLMYDYASRKDKTLIVFHYCFVWHFFLLGEFLQVLFFFVCLFEMCSCSYTSNPNQRRGTNLKLPLQPMVQQPRRRRRRRRHHCRGHHQVCLQEMLLEPHPHQ